MKYHMFDLVNHRGEVSALCFKKPRAINMKLASWTIAESAVTCRACLRGMAQLAEPEEE